MMAKRFNFRLVLLMFLSEFGLTFGIRKLYQTKLGGFAVDKPYEKDDPLMASIFDSPEQDTQPLFTFWDKTQNEYMYSLDSAWLGVDSLHFDKILGWVYPKPQSGTVPLFVYNRTISTIRGTLELRTESKKYYSTVEEYDRRELANYVQKDYKFKLIGIVAYILPVEAEHNNWRIAAIVKTLLEGNRDLFAGFYQAYCHPIFVTSKSHYVE